MGVGVPTQKKIDLDFSMIAQAILQLRTNTKQQNDCY